MQKIIVSQIARNWEEAAYWLLNRKNRLAPEMELVTTHWFPASTGIGLTAFQDAPGPKVTAAWSENPAELFVGQLMII